MESRLQKESILAHELTDFNFHSEQLEVHGARINFVHEGHENDRTILFLHGIPTWSYTFRKLFPSCIRAGFRVIAPDLPGCGRSECLPEDLPCSLRTLIDLLQEWLDQLNPKNLVVFGHDWGAILGMILLGRKPEQFRGFMACNGYLPLIKQRLPFLFNVWKLFCRYSPVFPIGRIVDLGSKRSLSSHEMFGYDYPYLHGKPKKIHRVLPGLLPFKEDSPEAIIAKETWDELQKWERPFSTVFGGQDLITRSGPELLRTHIPGARWANHKILPGGHFLQEDWPVELSNFLVDFAKHCP